MCVNFEPATDTVCETGTTALGSAMVLVALGVLPLMVVSVACGLPCHACEVNGDGLRSRGRVDDFDEELVRCVIARGGSEDARQERL